VDAQHRPAEEDDVMEFREERAAIAEYDGNLPRVAAEAYARTLTEQYRTRRARTAAPQPDMFGGAEEPKKPSGRKAMVAAMSIHQLKGMLS
jgi:hypothetical protein